MKHIAFVGAKDRPELVAAILDQIKWQFKVLHLPARLPPHAYAGEAAGVAADDYYT